MTFTFLFLLFLCGLCLGILAGVAAMLRVRDFRRPFLLPGLLLCLGAVTASPLRAQTDTVRTAGPDTTWRLGDSLLYGRRVSLTITTRKTLVVVDSVRPIPVILPGARGVPFGPYALPDGAPGPFSLNVAGVQAGSLLGEIARARTSKTKLILFMTGGSHDNYTTAGRFDRAKWNARMDSYNTPAIRTAITQAVADGVIIGNAVMDEPQQEGTLAANPKTWGPHGWMTKAVVDDLCGYVRGIFPTLPVGVVHDHRVFYPDQDYATCDFVGSQYRASKGPVAAFVTGGKSFTARSNIGLVLMLNVVHGGAKVGTGCGPGLQSGQPGLCNVSAAEIRLFGYPLLTGSSCAFAMWRWDSNVMSRPENKPAFQAVADSAAKLPGRSCRRGS